VKRIFPNGFSLCEKTKAEERGILMPRHYAKFYHSVHEANTVEQLENKNPEVFVSPGLNMKIQNLIFC